MALELIKQTLEIETCAGSAAAQALARAETLVPGAGREAVEVLLADATVTVDRVEAQAGRVVADATVRCQAVYRQGAETTLRALSANTQISQALELPDAEAGMAVCAQARAEHVEANYENGHMVFLVTVGLNARALALRTEEIVVSVEGAPQAELRTEEIASCKTAAETEVTSSLREAVELPAALDARASLMDWGAAWVDSWEADLGGVRVKGHVDAETILSSGLDGHPAATVRNTLSFDQLVELPEWLCRDVCAQATLEQLESRVEEGEEGEDAALTLDALVRIRVLSFARESAEAVIDLFATTGCAIVPEQKQIDYCADCACARTQESVKGTLLLSENAPGVGSVVCVTARPDVSGYSVNGESVIEGVIESTVLYLPGGSDVLASARSEMPFSVKSPLPLDGEVDLRVSVLSAEASALMSDRVELKCALGVEVTSRRRGRVSLVTEATEGEPVKKKPGIVLCWPMPGEKLWNVAKRYGLSVESVREMNGGAEELRAGQALVLRI